MIRFNSPRDIFGLVVVVAWAVLVSAFLVSNLVKEDTGFQMSSEVRVQPGETWLVLVRDEEEIGYVHEKRTLVPEGWLIEYRAVMRTTGVGLDTVLRTSIRATTDEKLRLERFNADVSLGSFRYDVFGEFRQDHIHLAQRRGQASVRDMRFDVDEAPRLASTVFHRILAQEGLEPGMQFQEDFFDPASMGISNLWFTYVGPTEIRNFNEVVRVHHFEQLIGGVGLDVFVDDFGEIVQQGLPLRVRASRLPPSLVNLTVSRLREMGIEDESMPEIDPENLVARVRGLDQFTGRHLVHLTNVPEDLVLDLDSLHQESMQLADGSFALDTANGYPQSLEQEERGRYLRAQGRYEAPADEDLLVDENLNSSRRAELIAERLLRWLDTRPTFDPHEPEPLHPDRDAVAIFDEGARGWSEASIVLVSALRKNQIPARFARGVRMTAGTMIPHTWVQYYDGLWVDLDLSSVLGIDTSYVVLVISETIDDERYVPALDSIHLEPWAADEDPFVRERADD